MATNTPDPLLDDPEPPKPRAPGTTSHADNEDKLVDQIVAEDKKDAIDDLYDSESEPEEPMLVTGDEKNGFLARLKRPVFWSKVFLLLLVVAIFAWLVTPSRLWLLNAVGLRGELHLASVVAAAQGTPPILKNTTITINGRDYHTDDAGKLKANLPYGALHIVVSKPGYETITKDQTLDFDPFFYYLGGKQADDAVRQQTFQLKNVGIIVSFMAKDWLTGDPLHTGNFAVGDVVAGPASDGLVTLTLPATDAHTVTVVAKFSGDFADTSVDVPVGNTKQEVVFVPAGKDYFISKRSGQFAVYSSGVDGSNVAEVVPASAAETGDITFSASPSGKFGVLGSTREATRDSFGSVQQKLYVVDLATNKLAAVDTALRFTPVDWADDTLVYVAQSRTAGGAMEQRLASINTATATQTTLSTAPSFRVVRVRLGAVLYLRSDNELRTIPIKGGTEKSLGTGVLQLTQTTADSFAYQIGDKSWHTYNVNAGQLTNAQTPASPERAFMAAPTSDGQTQLVIDVLDGKRTLLAKTVGNGQEKQLYAGNDLGPPARFIGTIVVYRVGTADYAISTRGGTPKKITDVTPSTNTNDYFTFY